MSEPIKILVVEDEEMFRHIYASHITRLGFEPILCAHGADALRSLDEINGIRLIITDVNMPIMDGLEFLETLQNSAYAGIPIVVVSAHCAPRELDERNISVSKIIDKIAAVRDMESVLEPVQREMQEVFSY